MSEQSTDGASKSVTSHTYRVEVKIPRIARPGTTWRTLVPPQKLSDANDYGAHLYDAMLDFGFDRSQIEAFFESHVRCVEYTNATTRERALPMNARS